MRLVPSGKTLYAVLSVIPFVVAGIGYAALLRAPYMGITFEQRVGKWLAGAVAPGGSAGSAGIEAGLQITAIGGLVLSGFDLVEDFD
jgi:predicted metalloprotease with PDZ domain